MNSILCKNCYGIIKSDTDDNYNSEHTEIQCPNCKSWFDLNSIEYLEIGERSGIDDTLELWNKIATKRSRF